MKQSGLGRHTL